MIEGAPKTNIKTIARATAFFGALLLMYAVASGLWLRSVGEAAEEAALQQHSIVGMVGTGLVIVSIVLLLRIKP